MSDVRPSPSVIDLPADRTLDGYDRWAASYDHGNPLVALSERVLDARPLACADLDVVELGCGTGRNAPRVLAEGARTYVGVDGSPGMLARAAGDDPRVQWRRGDLLAPAPLPVDAASADLVLVVLVLEHLSTLAPLAAEAARVLRPDGRLRVVDIHADLVRAGTRAQFRDGDAELRFTSAAHDAAAITEALAAAGLRVTRADDVLADAAAIAAVPKLARHAGRPVLLDLEATRT
jgi:SAM-dependent methyltransferase